ncbi:MAG: serine--tRNA ligase [Alphaproteobacteria bacterium]|nr:serine--tRNA ligase [Alphaproteobacteria bacterium]
MHDPRLIRDHPQAFDAALAKRGIVPVASELIEVDGERRAVVQRLQQLQNRRNEASRLVGQKKAKGQDAAAEMAELGELRATIQQAEADERRAQEAFEQRLADLPNLPADDVPAGDESANLEIRRVGTPPDLAEARQHFELGEALGLMDFEAAAKLSGSRFVVLRGALAQLERALALFMLDLHTAEFGYQEISAPLLVKAPAAFGTGNLPKFEADLFKTAEGFYLIPTAEMTLTNLVRERILDESELPLRVTAWTPCFRSEAGAAGRDTRGMLRQHQFAKVELVSITTPEQSAAEHERMTACAEEVLKRLGLAYRVMLLAAGDMGFSARKTYDIEVWLPGQRAYREISSCSNCGEFQARRMDARYRPAGGKGTRFVHSLNGSGLAVGRALIAVLENYQQPDGSIAVPAALRPYLGGRQRIGRQEEGRT